MTNFSNSKYAQLKAMHLLFNELPENNEQQSKTEVKQFSKNRKKTILRCEFFNS